METDPIQDLAKNWTGERLRQHIKDKVPEGYRLDYKGHRALPLSAFDGTAKEKTRQEIIKDVSSFANSDGGVLVYGIATEKEGKTEYPSIFDPVQTGEISCDQLAQIIGQKSQPVVPGVRVFEVADLGPGFDGTSCFVVVVPPSDTVHMAQDGRYYYRHEGTSLVMSDHMIRQGMNRAKDPKIEVIFSLGAPSHTHYALKFFVRNVGRVLSRFYKIRIRVTAGENYPSNKWQVELRPRPHVIGENLGHIEIELNHEIHGIFFPGSEIAGAIQIHPVNLPARPAPWASRPIDIDETIQVRASIFADNVPVAEGKSTLQEVYAKSSVTLGHGR